MKAKPRVADPPCSKSTSAQMGKSAASPASGPPSGMPWWTKPGPAGLTGPLIVKLLQLQLHALFVSSETIQWPGYSKHNKSHNTYVCICICLTDEVSCSCCMM